MRPIAPLTLLALAALTASTQAAAQYTACPVRAVQHSPVNIRTYADSAFPDVSASYPEMAGRAFNHTPGRNFRVNVANGGELTVGDRHFKLVEFHFHWPAEHERNGRRDSVEIHMVHQWDQDPNVLAVVSTWGTLGPPTPAWNAVWARFPTTDTIPVRVDIAELFRMPDLPREQLFTYCGSLTNPPYEAGVTWLVRARPITFSRAQLNKLHRIMPRYSHRTLPLHVPIQHRPAS